MIHQSYFEPKVAVSGIEGDEVTEETFSKLTSSSSLSSEAAATVYSGICTLLRCALRLSQNSLKPEVRGLIGHS